jgi:hypothetical protein
MRPPGSASHSCGLSAPGRPFTEPMTPSCPALEHLRLFAQPAGPLHAGGKGRAGQSRPRHNRTANGRRGGGLTGAGSSLTATGLRRDRPRRPMHRIESSGPMDDGPGQSDAQHEPAEPAGRGDLPVFSSRILAPLAELGARPPGRSGLEEGQQVSVDGLGLGGRHAVRESVVRLQRPVLHELRGSADQPGG